MEEVDDEEYWKREEHERSEFYESESELRWMWGAGLYFGKNMVVTTVVISTVPLVLPPLVALSAIGFAFSLPAGFALATFACTDKLMNTLLPMPPASYVEPGSEENDDIGSEVKEFEVHTRKKVELVEDGDGDRSVDRYEIPVRVDDEHDTWMRVPVIVEEDVDEGPSLDSNVIPVIIEGIREAENEISLMEREGVLTPNDALLGVVVEAEVDEENEGDVEQVTEVLAFVPQTDTGEEIPYGGGLTVAPEGFYKAAGERGKGIEELPEVVIERTVVLNETKMADEGGVDNPTEIQNSSSDSFNKRLQGEDFVSDSGVGSSTDYLEVQIKTVSISGQTEIEVDQEITSGIDKALISEEKIWEQINAMRTIIGCKTATHTSCAEELKVLYEFTGIDLPVSSKDGTDLANVNEKLNFLKAIIGVK